MLGADREAPKAHGVLHQTKGVEGLTRGDGCGWAWGETKGNGGCTSRSRCRGHLGEGVMPGGQGRAEGGAQGEGQRYLKEVRLGDTFKLLSHTQPMLITGWSHQSRNGV